MAKKTIILLVAILIPILCLIGVFVFFGKPEKDNFKLPELPYISDTELKQRIIFTTDDLNTQEKEEIVIYLLENERRNLVNADKAEVREIIPNGSSYKEFCRNSSYNKYQLLPVQIFDLNKDKYKSGWAF